jgi:hypothetical protein
MDTFKEPCLPFVCRRGCDCGSICALLNVLLRVAIVLRVVIIVGQYLRLCEWGRGIMQGLRKLKSCGSMML